MGIGAPIDELTAAIHARVSSSENKPNLESQAKQLESYCAARGYRVSQVAKEVGSGLNDSRPKLTRLLTDGRISVIVIEDND